MRKNATTEGGVNQPVATIEIPRLPGERNERYQARVLYLTMGPGRSLAAVGQKLNKSTTLMGRWSAEDRWADHARKYDEQVAFITIQQAAEQYRNDLEEHRRRYQQSGRALHGIAIDLLVKLRERSGDLEYTTSTLTTISRALQIAADLEAHALRVGDLLPRLSDDLHSSE